MKTMRIDLHRLLMILAAVLLLTAASASLAYAEDGVTIKSPADQSLAETGNPVEVTVKPEYQVPEGSPTLFNKWPNYLYIKVSMNGRTIRYNMFPEDGYVSILTLVSDKKVSFTPTEEGIYLIEVCRHLEYVDGEYVPLAEEDFVPGDSITITVQKDISKAETEVAGVSDKVYNGKSQTQNLTVTVDGKELGPDDYTVAYANNVNKGTASVSITGKGLYKGTVTRDFEIAAADISKAAVSGLTALDYTGSAQTQDPVVTLGGRTLAGGTDYDVAWADNTNAGTASVTFTGKENYKGTLTKTFTIRQASILNATLSGLKDKAYTGSAVTQSLTLKYSGKTLTSGTDYTITYMNNVEPGTASVIIKGKGNFRDQMTRTFSITERSSSPGLTTITSPADGTQVKTGSKVTVKARPGWFMATWYHGSQLDAPNYLYVKVTHNGATVLYAKYPYKSTSEVQTIEFTAGKSGEYVIGVMCHSFVYKEVEKENGKFTLQYQEVAEENFVPESSIRITASASPTAVRDLSSATISGVSDKQYTGNAITQSPVVKLNDVTLVNGTDYYVLYNAGGENVNVGPVVCEIHGKGKYTGIARKLFNITPRKISADMITLTPGSFTYNGELQKPDAAVKNGDILLRKGTDYTIVNEGGTEPGEYSVEVSAAGNGNYTGSATKKYTIGKISIGSADVTVEPSSYVYDGTAKKPAVSVTLDGQAFPEEFYTVSYSKNKNAGTATATVTAAADSVYQGSASADFKIRKADIGAASVTVGPIGDKVYNRKAQTPVPEVLFGETALQQGTDFKTAYQGNTNAGTASVTITGTGNFSGSRDTSFRIKPKDISSPSIKAVPIPDQLYKEGTPSTPAVTVKDGTAALTGKEITVEYADNDKPGTARVTVTGKGNYTGSRSDITFEILEEAAYAAASLTDAVAEIEKDLSRYTDSDQKTLSEAVDEAKKLLADPNASAEDLKAALSELNELKAAADVNLAKEKKAASAMPAAANTEKTILGQKKDKDPAGSAFAPLQLKSVKQTKKSNTLKWKKVPGASAYVIYGSKSGNSNRIKKIATVKKTSYTHKKLKKGTYYKYVVIAVKDTVAGKRTAAVSRMIHISTKGGKAGNYKAVKVSKKVIKKARRLKKGKKLKLAAKAKKGSARVRSYIGLRYESSDKKIAAVSKKGVVKGVRKGTCYIYAYAQNGVCKRVKVIVK